MEHEKIERLNELARKKKTIGLSQEEVVEQAALRREYIDGFKENLKAVLDATVIQQPDGTKVPLKRKKPN